MTLIERINRALDKGVDSVGSNGLRLPSCRRVIAMEMCRHRISKVISRGFSTGSVRRRFADGCNRSVGAALGWIRSKYAKRSLQGD